MARGVAFGCNALFAHQAREVLAPISQELLVDVQPPAELTLGLDDQMHVRLLLMGVQDHRVAVLREFLAGELPRSGQNLVRGRGRRHGKHDVVNKLRRLVAPARRSSAAGIVRR